MATHATVVKKVEMPSYLCELYTAIQLFAQVIEKESIHYYLSQVKVIITIIKLSSISPCSATTCLKLPKKEQIKVTKAAQESNLDINVGKVTHDELMALVSKIPHQSHSELEKLIRKARGKLCDGCGGNMLKIDLHFKRTSRRMVCIHVKMIRL